MSVKWSSKFRSGKNIALENSFRFLYRNETQQNQIVNTFSIGSQNTPNYISNNGIFFPLLDLVNSGVVDASFKFINNTYFILDGENVGIYSTTFVPIGTPLSDLPSLVGTITAPNGQSTSIFYIEYPLNVKLASFFIPIITIPTRLRFTQNPTPPLLPYFQTQNVDAQGVNSYDPNNPFVFIGTQSSVPLTAVQNDGLNSVIGILGIDIYSSDPNQVIQSIDYTYKDSNGDLISISADPIVSPYQPQYGSIQGINLEGINLNNETTLSYTLKPFNSAYLTINYVKFTIYDYYEFDKVFKQQIMNDFLLQKKLLDRSRLSLLQVE